MTAPRASEDAICLSLREAILSRRLAPGTRLREVRPGKIHGATRGEVRKAPGRLAFEGLVERRPNRGASVAQNLTTKALKRLQARLGKERAARQKRDAGQIAALSGEFHILLAEIAGNATPKRDLEDFVARGPLILQLFRNQPQDDCTSEQHDEIAAALRAADPDLIARRIETHIDGIAAGLDPTPRVAEPRPLEEIPIGVRPVAGWRRMILARPAGAARWGRVSPFRSDRGENAGAAP